MGTISRNNWARLVLGTALAAASMLCSASALAQGDGALMVATPVADGRAEALASGYAVWLTGRIEAAGMRSVAASTRTTDLASALEAASAASAAYVVVPDLRVGRGRFHIRLRLYASGGDELVGIARSEAPLASLGAACVQSSDDLLDQLGVVSPGGPAPIIEELATSGRAIDFVERGELARAFREVQGKLSPTTMRMRDSILATAENSNTPLAERARLLTASGDDRKAWSLIVSEVKRQAKSPEPDRKLLLAAAEVQLARNKPKAAIEHLERLVAINPDDADVQLDLGIAYSLGRDRPKARQALELAAKLDPANPRSLSEIRDLSEDDPFTQASVVLRAADQESRRFNLSRAERLYARAVELSPSLESDVARGRARMNEDVGRHQVAVKAWQEAVDTDPSNAEAWTGLGRVQRLTGDAAAQASLERAIEIDPSNTGALSELGRLHVDFGRAQAGESVLREAVKSDPGNAEIRRDLARALSSNGKQAQALEVLVGPEAGPSGAETLRAAAEIQRDMGDLEGARKNLDRAIVLEPHDGGLHEELAVTLEASGDSDGADDAMSIALSLEGSLDESGQAPTDPTVSSSLNLDDLVLGFSSQITRSGSRSVAHLGARNPTGWRPLLERWVMPRISDEKALTQAVEVALSRRFNLVEPVPPETPAFGDAIDRLYDFDSRASLDARAIADVNALLDTQGIFLTRLVTHIGEPEQGAVGACADPWHVVLEVRMLAGDHADLVTILANKQCLPSPMQAHGVWNVRAGVVYLLALMLLIGPIARGFGTVMVEINLPPRTKGFLNIRISTKTMSAEQGTKKKRRRRPSKGMQMSLLNFSRYRKQMAHRETLFRWIPARRNAYYVFVSGPLFDALGESEIGHFLEEQRAQVVRGKTLRLRYDLNPSECALQVTPIMNGQPVENARVALRDQPESLRYARNGLAHFVVGPGTYTVLVGFEDRAAECTVSIENVERAIPIEIDLTETEACMVRNCAEAVEPYLLGDFATTARILTAAGEEQVGHLMMGAHHQQRGENELAADEFEAAGCIEEAAELRASGANQGKAADLFEQAGDFERAAEAHRAAGDLEDAARCYEGCYDYDQALECYLEVGNFEKALAIQETVGAYLDAAMLAKQHGDSERALANLQNIEKRDPNYSEAQRMCGELLAERGDYEVAAQKLGEAIELAGGDNAPIDLHELRAQVLAKGENKQDALAAYETVRRMDPQRDDVTQHIAALKEEIATTQIATTGMGPASSASDPPQESRYELLAEIGRGGMGVVYKARDKRLNRIVALKQLPNNLRDNQTAARLFVREAQAAAALNHTNITTVYDAGEENGTFHITMELLDGLALNQIQERRGPLSERDASRLGIQVCAGLDYAHRQRIVHRDIKPANLFFTTDKIVKIMDFGLAKSIEEVRKTSTMIGGTPYYMAPEQAAGESVDNRTDLYAFGVTLFRMVTGTFPFSEGDLAYHHRHTAPPDPREAKPDLHPGMADLILALIQKDPEARPDTAADVAGVLQGIFKSTQNPT